MPVYSTAFAGTVLVNRPRRDGTLSWRWCTAATGGIRTHDLAVPSPAPYHSATAHQNKNRNKLELEYAADRTHFSASPSDERLAMMTVPCGSVAALHSVMPSRPANRGSSTLNVITDLGSGSSAVTPMQTNPVAYLGCPCACPPPPSTDRNFLWWYFLLFYWFFSLKTSKFRHSVTKKRQLLSPRLPSGALPLDPTGPRPPGPPPFAHSKYATEQITLFALLQCLSHTVHIQHKCITRLVETISNRVASDNSGAILFIFVIEYKLSIDVCISLGLPGEGGGVSQ